MNEPFEQALTYVRSILRYRWVALGCAWILAIVGWATVFVVPDKYEATARVHVDTESVLRPLLKGMAVDIDISRQVSLMNRTLLSRPNLEKVARATDLDLQAKNATEFEALLDQLAKDIKLEGSMRNSNLYTISYQNRDRDFAKKVVQALLTIFVESTLGQKREDAGSAREFLDQQIKEYEARLTEAENRLMEFKRKNMGMLPEQGVDFYARLQTARSDLEKGKLELREAQFKRNELHKELEEFEKQMSSGSQVVLHTSVDDRLQALQRRLDELLLRYTESHPDVEELKSSIAVLEKQKDKELAELKGKAVTGSMDASPTYQELKRALGQANADLAAVRVRVNEYSNRLKKLQAMVDTLPKVEAELKRLNRDYGVNRENYDNLLARREAARISKDVEQAGDNVKFKIIDPPRVPLLPSAPNRPLLSTVVLVVAFGVAGLLAIVLAQVRPTVHDQRSLHELTQLPVYGAVSRLWSPDLQRKRRLEIASFSALSFCLFTLYGGVLFLYISEANLRERIIASVQGIL